jgi:D-sedoheptulose 7-phosphate isomerase
MKNKLKKSLEESVNTKKKLIKLDNKIQNSISLMYKTIKDNYKVMICGNGGSAADAQHLAAEFLVRLRPKVNRQPLPIFTLAMDTSTITACSNDYKFEDIFYRPLKALGKKNDLLICISTSGNSKNLIKAIKEAKRKKIYVISFLGKKGGKMRNMSDIEIIVPSNNVARIQECHIFLGHFIFEQVENLILKNNNAKK